MAAAETRSPETRPVFRRPTRDDALALARTQFLAGERVEMQTLAAELDISRTTLYRWLGEREQLMGELFSVLIGEWLAQIAPDAEGEGFDLFVDMLRRFLDFAANFEPLTEFTQREPALALRILTARDGAVTAMANGTVRDLLRQLEPDVAVPDSVADAIGLIARTLVWANIASGAEPDIDGVVEVAGTLLANCRAD